MLIPNITIFLSALGHVEQESIQWPMSMPNLFRLSVEVFWETLMTPSDLNLKENIKVLVRKSF